jgi:hypothetical protein
MHVVQWVQYGYKNLLKINVVYDNDVLIYIVSISFVIKLILDKQIEVVFHIDYGLHIVSLVLVIEQIMNIVMIVILHNIGHLINDVLFVMHHLILLILLIVILQQEYNF